MRAHDGDTVRGDTPVRHRVILHVDMDMFYVAIELRERPELRGRPVVVGGSGPRGVVSAASYEARRFGVFSAMPSVRAQRLCPEAVFLPGQPALYRAASRQVHEIFASFTPLVEGIALDEAFLDVTGALRQFGTPLEIADRIRERVAAEVGITCSVGIAPNKFLAKIASKMAKPRATPQGVEPGPGVVIVEPGRETEFLHPLPVRALWGVGPATHEKLDKVGVKTVGELAALDDSIVVAMLGNATGRHLHRLAHGLDDRPVEPQRDAKSIGHEETFATDVFDLDVLRSHLVRLSDAVAARVRGADLVARTLTLKIKFANFRSITRSVTLESPRASGPGFTEALAPLLAEVDASPGVRLLGVSASQLSASDAPRPPVQASLFDDPVHGESSSDEREVVWSSAGSAIDDIRAKFGRDAIRTAGTLAHGTDVGENPWGPPAPEQS
jgi:DNA polymerase-4